MTDLNDWYYGTSARSIKFVQGGDDGADGAHICLTNAPISNQSMQYQ